MEIDGSSLFVRGFELSAPYPNSECTIGGAHSWYRNEASVLSKARLKRVSSRPAWDPVC